ncbi:MAG: UDP-N-acetylmuramate--L-alanine ligase [Planctomycetes bacterium]|nr:UDP-N-acetylmuramate--L-alanine ligase [Planctomycetota bacterium]
MAAEPGRARQIHLVGIGGSGLASLAAYLLERGERVSGCDLKDGAMLRLLRARGATIAIGHDASHCSDSLDLLVYTAAANGDHPELAAAATARVRALKYAQCLGEETQGKQCVAVAGTHGKTTTTTLIAEMLMKSGLDPSAVVGGFPASWPLPGRAGAGPHFVVEACEYDRSFHNFAPQVAVVTNVEPDHLDYFGTHENVIDAFIGFLGRVVEGGAAVVHESAALALGGRSRCRLIVVGEGQSCAARLVVGTAERGCGRGRLHLRGSDPIELAPPIAGEHNLIDAALAATAAVALGAAPYAIEQAVREFRGVRRRLEVLCARGGVQFLSDYAHHPTEIRAVREALRASHPGKRLLVVFQPHQASRTRDFRDDFASELAAFDEVVVPNIFAVREAAAGVERETEALVAAIGARGRAPHRAAGLNDVFPTIDRIAHPGDLVVLMGAGDIDDLAEVLRAPAAEPAVA